jgi:hypothetical protein
MKQLFILLLFCLASVISNAQITAIVKNPTDQKPIPYVNIWAENENIGVTADENGKFTITAPINSKLIFNALGYDNKIMEVSKIDGVVYLIPKVFELKEVVVRTHQNELIETNELDTKNINLFFSSNNNNPWILSKYFENKSTYEKTPYLKEVSVITNSTINNAKFGIRIYSVGNDGSPKDLLTNNQLLGIAKKGKNISKIDVSNLYIKFPDNGIFIAVESMIMNSNVRTYEYKRKIDGKNKIEKITFYEPSFGRVMPDETPFIWLFTKGKWGKINFNESTRNEKFRSNKLAVELTLIN